ncbi:hypothetical protein GCM10022293_18130 [Azospirillum formosense]
MPVVTLNGRSAGIPTDLKRRKLHRHPVLTSALTFAAVQMPAASTLPKIGKRRKGFRSFLSESSPIATAVEIYRGFP